MSKEVVKLKAVNGENFEIKGNRLSNSEATGYDRYVTKRDLKAFFGLKDTSFDTETKIATTYYKGYEMNGDPIINHFIFTKRGQLNIGCMRFNRETTATIKEFALSSTKSNKVVTPSRKRKVA